MKFRHESKDKLRRVTFYGIVGVIFIIAAVLIQINIMFNQANTFNVVFCYEGSISEENKALFAETIQNAISEKQPDAIVTVKIDWLFYNMLVDPESFNAVMTQMAQDNYSLYILSDQPQTLAGSEGETNFEGLSSLFCSKEWFDPLDDYGIEPDVKYNSRVGVNSSKIFSDIEIGETEFYASIIDWYKAGDGEKEDLTYSLSVISYLLDNLKE